MLGLLIAPRGMAIAGAAGAKLPAASPKAQARAEEARQKAAWPDKVAAFQLCQAQDRVVANYRHAKGAQAKPEAATPPCQDLDPYVPTAAAAKIGVADSLPVPAAGKPSPPVESKK